MNSSIVDLNSGETGIIRYFHDEHATCKLISMGLAPNVRVEVIRKAPFGGTLYIKADKMYMALREEEAASIEIEVV